MKWVFIAAVSIALAEIVPRAAYWLAVLIMQG
jgi:hypothetical protein